MSRSVTVATEPRHYANGLVRREQILDAATELFAVSGYRAVSLRDVAKHVGISHPGLLRHVASRDDLLLAILNRLERVNEAWFDSMTASDLIDITAIVELAGRNARVPGYVELYTSLAGQATTADHPAHQHFKAHYETVRDVTTAHFSAAQAAGVTPVGFEPAVEAVRFGAAWDGLQIQSLYAPSSVDVEDHLRRHAHRLAGIADAAFGMPRPGAQVHAQDPAQTHSSGYASGRERRARIVADAARLFAVDGYNGTSLREIAERVGISKSTLLHHFASKQDLLTAVLMDRDELFIPPFSVDVGYFRDWLLDLPVRARANAQTPEHVRLYTALSCEATAVDHPAHQYFADRFEFARSQFQAGLQALADRGELAPGIEPEHEAVWLVALWDGLQIQWLLDPAAVCVPDLFETYVNQLVVGG